MKDYGLQVFLFIPKSVSGLTLTLSLNSFRLQISTVIQKGTKFKKQYLSSAHRMDSFVQDNSVLSVY